MRASIVSAALFIVVAPQLLFGGADLTSSVTSVTPSSAAPGTSITIGYRVSNIGTASAASSGLKLYVSSSPFVDGSATYLSPAVSIPSLPGSSAVSGTVTRTLPSLGCGPYYIVSQADAFSAVAEDNESNNVASSPISITGCSPPGSFSLLSPANGSTVTSSSVTLSWSASSGATSYALYFGASPSFYASTTGTSFTVSLTGSGTYSWYVVASNANGSTTSSTWTFSSCSVPSAPVLVSPANGATVTGTSTTLTWNAVAGATSYDLYAGSSSSPAFLGNFASTSITVTGLANGVTYYWKVVAKNSCGSSPASSMWSFTANSCTPPGAFTYIAPSNGYQVDPPSTSLWLVWHLSSGADSYDLSFGTSPSPPLLTNMSAAMCGASDCRVQLTSLSYSTTYYWSVTAKNACGSYAGSPWSFTNPQQPTVDLVASVTASPGQINPGGVLTVTYVVSNQGTLAAGPSTLRLWLSNDNVFDGSDRQIAADQAVSTVNGGTSTPQTTITATIPPATAPGVYYVLAQADATNAVAESNETNNVGAYPIQVAGPCTYSITPTSASPAASASSGSVSVTTQSSCSWTASSNASWLSITGGASGSGSGTVTYAVAENTSTSSRTGTLTIAGQTFTITQAGAVCTAPSTPNLIGPPNGSTVSGSSVTLTWSGVSGATSYQVFVGTSPNPPQVGIASGPVFTYGGISLGQYYWKIVATNSCGASAPSTVWSFAAGGVSCTYSISPASASAAASASSGSVSVTTQSGCSWTASSNASWISITSATSGSGSGTVTYSVASNTSSSSRTGTLIIAGQTFTLTQAGQPASAPDLVAKSIVVSPSAPTENTDLSITGIISNDAAASVQTPFNWALKVDGATLRTGRPAFLAAGGQITGASIYWTGRINAGSHVVQLIADSSGEIAESNEANNSISQTITIAPAPACPGSFSLTSPTPGALIAASTPVSLSWSASSGATSYDVYLGPASVPPLFANVTATQITVSSLDPDRTYFWTVVAKNACGTARTATASFTIGPLPVADLTGAVILDRPRVIAGDSVRITYSIVNSGAATAPPSTVRLWLSSDITVDAQRDVLLSTESVQALAPNGATSATVARTIPSTVPPGPFFVLAEADSGAAVTESNEANNIGYAALTVDSRRAPALVIVATLPNGMVQRENTSGATDFFTLANIGGTPTTVTFTQSASFFQLPAGSLFLDAGAQQTVSIAATAQPAGVFDGTVTLSGDGVPAGLSVPVRLLSLVPPPEPARVVALEGRVEIVAPADQNPSGTVAFKNIGGSVFQGIAVSDAAWLLPTRDIITIAPNETKNVAFAIDRSSRPDAAALIGGVAGLLSLRFAPTSGFAKGAAADGGSGTTVSVTIVDVVKSNTSTNTAPPLAAGEVAVFLPGLGLRDLATGDLLLANRSSRGIPLDLRLYFTSSAGTQSMSAQVPASSTVVFPSIAKTTFNVPYSGSLQVRGASAGELAVLALQLVPAGARQRTLQLPALRSDLGAAPGERVVLAGVEKTGSTATTLYVQEVAGHAALIRIDYLDADGRTVSSRPEDALPPFSSIELKDAVPFGAMTARVTNVSGSGSRIAAYAVAADSASGDAFVITDMTGSAKPAASAHIIPLVAPASVSAPDRSVFLSNNTNDAADVAIDTTVLEPPRRRTVRTSTNGAGSVSANGGSMILTVLPNKTVSADLSAVNGYATLSAAAGQVSASGRTQTIVPAAGRTALAATAVTNAIGYGQVRVFIGVDDTSRRTIGAGIGGSSRSSLVLIETAGQSATVRVTLRFTFPAGGKVSGTGTSTRDFAINAKQMLVIDEIGRAIIGTDRDNLPDLRNVRVDVEIVSGSGKVLPFIQAVDNGSGECAMRAD